MHWKWFKRSHLIIRRYLILIFNQIKDHLYDFEWTASSFVLMLIILEMGLMLFDWSASLGKFRRYDIELCRVPGRKCIPIIAVPTKSPPQSRSSLLVTTNQGEVNKTMGKINICLQLKVLKQTNLQLSALFCGSWVINFKWTQLPSQSQEKMLSCPHVAELKPF